MHCNYRFIISNGNVQFPLTFTSVFILSLSLLLVVSLSRSSYSCRCVCFALCTTVMCQSVVYFAVCVEF